MLGKLFALVNHYKNCNHFYINNLSRNTLQKILIIGKIINTSPSRAHIYFPIF